MIKRQRKKIQEIRKALTADLVCGLLWTTNYSEHERPRIDESNEVAASLRAPYRCGVWWATAVNPGGQIAA